MLTKAKKMKIKRFFKNPVYLLAAIVSLAAVGVGSAVAVQAFADGEVATVPDYLITGDDRHYDTATINYLYLSNSGDYAQVYCSESGTETETLTHDYSGSGLDNNSFKKGDAPFSIQMYDSDNDGTDDTNYTESTVTINSTSALPDKTYYVFQPDEDWNEKYVGSFNIQNSTLLRTILINNYDNNITIAELIADCGLDTTDDVQATYSPSADSTYVYDAKGTYNTDDPDYLYWDHQGNFFNAGNASYILNCAGFDFNAATYHFVGLKQKTYYKYGDPIMIHEGVCYCNYAQNVSVILPKSTGSRSYIAIMNSGETIEEAMEDYRFLPIDRRSLSGVLGIPGNAGTIMTFDPTGTAGLYVPLNVNVHYAVEAPSGATLTNDGGLDNHTDTVTDNTLYNPCLQSDTFKSMSFQPDSSHTVPQCTISGETQDATGWESVNDSDKIFGLRSISAVRDIFSATNYNVTFNNGLITLTVPVKAMFPVAATYTVTYQVTSTDPANTAYELPTDTTEYNEGAPVTVAESLSVDGYSFDGWKKDGSVVTNFTMPAENVTLTGSFDKLFTLHFNTDGGSNISDSQFTYSGLTADEKTAGKRSFSVTAPTKDGYTFTGWQVAEDTSVTFDKDNSGSAAISYAKFTQVGATTTYQATANAQWKKNYTLNYHANLAGVTDPVSETFFADDTNISGGQYTFPTKSVSKSGYIFKGWGTADNATTTVTAIDFNETTYTYGVYGVWQNTVTYQDGYTNDTTQDKTYDVITGQSHSIIANPFTRTGYTFAGWQLVSPASGYATSGSITVNENVTYKATWTVNQHNVTYTVSGDVPTGYSTASLNKTNVAYGTLVTVEAAPAFEGYTFAGWTTSDVTVSGGTFTMPDNDVTLTGTFTKNSYTVHYELTGADQPTVTLPGDETVLYGENYTVAEKLNVPGYTFTGWKKDGADVTSFNMPADNVTLQGTFTKNSYTVHYELTGADQPTVTLPGDETVPYGENYTVAEKLNVPGYTFTGWKKDGADVTSFNMPAANVTLQGTFTKNSYTVQYVLTSDSATPSGISLPTVETVAFGINYTVADKLTADGYTFMGWTVQSGDPADITLNTDNSVKSFKMPAGNVTLQGKFTEIHVPTYSVTYQVTSTDPAASAYTLPTDAAAYHENDPVTVAGTLSVEGYTFDGWYKETEKVTSFFMPGDDVTLTGSFTVNKHNVTYTVSGDVPTGYSTASLNKTNVAYGTSVTVEAAPDIEGYTFAGWTTSDATVSGGAFTMPDKDVTLAGVFTKNPEPAPTYTLIYNCNTTTYTDLTGLTGAPADETLTAASFTDGQYQLTTAYPDSDNFRFVCWSRTKNYSVANIVEKVAVSDFNAENQCEVYAIWVAKLDVTYKCGIDESDPAWQYNKQTTNHVFELDHYTLNYRVLDNEELDQPFVYPGHRITKWRVVSGWDKIEFPSQPSGGSSATAAAPAYRRSGSGDENHYLEFGTMIILHGDVEVEAVWEEIPVTLTYHANGGSPESAVPNSGNSINHMIDDKVTVQDGSGLKNGELVFAYWSTTANDQSGSKHYNKDDTFTIEKDTDLYAIYKTAPKSEGGKEFTVTYDPNGGTGTVPTDSNKYTGGDTVTVKDKGNLVRTDCTFKEWNTKKDGSGTGYKGDGTATFTMPESNVTLYAIWVDSSGNIVSPRTGENDLPLQLAFNMAIIALLGVAFVSMKQKKWRKDI